MTMKLSFDISYNVFSFQTPYFYSGRGFKKKKCNYVNITNILFLNNISTLCIYFRQYYLANL